MFIESNNPCWIAYYCTVFRNVFDNNRACTNDHISSYVDVFDYRNMWANVYVVSDDCWCVVIRANRKELTKIAIVTYDGSGIYNYPYSMTNIESITDFCCPWNLNAILD